MSEPNMALQDKSEFYLTLARAFMTPMSEESFQAMNEYLADDLADMDQSLGYGLDPYLNTYRGEMAKIPCHEDLLIIYSRIFLQPPREAQINPGVYLDGAFMGGSVDEMNAFYRQFGVERGDHFKDLPDHVSVQLEFVSYLYARATEALQAGTPDDKAVAGAGHFLFQFVRRWLPKFQADLEKTTRELAEIGIKANPYLPLAQMLWDAVMRDAAPNPEWVEEKSRADLAMDKARATYAARGVTPEDLAEMKRKLEEKGLSADHLNIPVDGRDEAMGWTPKTPPSHRHK